MKKLGWWSVVNFVQELFYTEQCLAGHEDVLGMNSFDLQLVFTYMLTDKFARVLEFTSKLGSVVILCDVLQSTSSA